MVEEPSRALTTDAPHTRLVRVGLTGGIASGKSHVRRRLAAAGFATLDLDEIARQVTQPGGSVFAAVVEAFGPAVQTREGGLDRAALGQIVFSDPRARAQLDALVHPRIREVEEARAESAAREGQALLVTDGALLIEVGSHLRFERLIVAHCSEQAQLERIVKRDGLQPEAARQRLASQMPMAEKRRFASWVIDTERPLERTDQQIDALARELRALAANRPAVLSLSPRRALAFVAQLRLDRPRGFRDVDVLQRIAGARRVDLQLLAKLLDPTSAGPWYEAPGRLGDERGPETLAALLALWQLKREGLDATRVVAMAASVARLTHRGDAAIASACLAAEAVAWVARDGAIPAAWKTPSCCWRLEADKWGPSEPSARVIAAVTSAAAHPREWQAARDACQRARGDAALCGALVALGSGARESEEPPADAAQLCRLLGLDLP